MEIEVIEDLRLSKIEHLINSSIEEGFNFLARLSKEWDNGINQFKKANERLYQIKLDGKVIGIGGINQDPYHGTGEIGRIRHVYIQPNYRNRGIGKKLVITLIEAFQDHYEKITLRTDSEAASKFYESIGFIEVNDSDTATHHILTSWLK